jgi:hypothetical protein
MIGLGENVRRHVAAGVASLAYMAADAAIGDPPCPLP